MGTIPVDIWTSLSLVQGLAMTMPNDFAAQILAGMNSVLEERLKGDRSNRAWNALNTLLATQLSSQSLTLHTMLLQFCKSFLYLTSPVHTRPQVQEGLIQEEEEVNVDVDTDAGRVAEEEWTDSNPPMFATGENALKMIKEELLEDEIIRVGPMDSSSSASAERGDEHEEDYELFVGPPKKRRSKRRTTTPLFEDGTRKKASTLNEKNQVCPYCEYDNTLRTLSSMTVHIQMEHLHKYAEYFNRECREPECDFRTNAQSSISQHRRTVHNDELWNKWKNEKRFNLAEDTHCPVCHDRIHSLSDVKEHTVRHQFMMPLDYMKCSGCDLNFSLINKLYMHWAKGVCNGATAVLKVFSPNYEKVYD